MPMCSLVRRLRARRAGSRHHDGEQPDINEKETVRRRNRLNVSAGILRFLQCLSAWAVYASLALLYHSFSPSVPLGDHSSRGPPNYIRKLSSSAVLYHCSVLVFIGLLRRVKTSVTWRVFAVGTVLLDLVMMVFAITNITVLSAIGLPTGCQALPRSDALETHELRQLVADYSNAFFGRQGDQGTEELSSSCAVPKIVYVLSVISIFSHTLSIVLTVLQFQQNKAQRETETRIVVGHVEEAVPQAVLNRNNTWSQRATPPTSSQYTEQRLAEIREQLVASLSAPRTQTTTVPTHIRNAYQGYTPAGSNTGNSGPVPAIAMTDMFTNPPGWRSSQETTSSFNPDLYLVSDGFRPLPSPPAYTSRPSSLFDVRT